MPLKYIILIFIRKDEMMDFSFNVLSIKVWYMYFWDYNSIWVRFKSYSVDVWLIYHGFLCVLFIQSIQSKGWLTNTKIIDQSCLNKKFLLDKQPQNWQVSMGMAWQSLFKRLSAWQAKAILAWICLNLGKRLTNEGYDWSNKNSSLKGSRSNAKK